MNPSPNLFLIGPTGAGKTTLGAWLAPRLGLALLDLDRIVAAQAGMPISEIFSREGEVGFRVREAAALAEHCTHCGVLLVGGGGIVTRPENRTRLAQNGYVLWLVASVELRASRLEGDRSRPLLSGHDLRSRMQQLDDERESLYAGCADLALEQETEMPIEALGRRALSLLAERWQRSALREIAP